MHPRISEAIRASCVDAQFAETSFKSVLDSIRDHLSEVELSHWSRSKILAEVGQRYELGRARDKSLVVRGLALNPTPQPKRETATK